MAIALGIGCNEPDPISPAPDSGTYIGIFETTNTISGVFEKEQEQVYLTTNVTEDDQAGEVIDITMVGVSFYAGMSTIFSFTISNIPATGDMGEYEADSKTAVGDAQPYSINNVKVQLDGYSIEFSFDYDGHTIKYWGRMD